MSDLASLHRADLVRSGADHFVQVGRTFALAKGEIGRAEKIAAALRLTPRAAGIVKAGVVGISKTVIASGSTDVSSWAAEISAYQTIAASFIASLKSFSAFDAMADSFVQLPLHVRATCTTLGATGFTPGEMQAVPIKNFTFAADTLRERVSYAMIVVTQELLENTTAAAFNKISNDLKSAVARG